jgi:predicted P-loop ATPase
MVETHPSVAFHAAGLHTFPVYFDKIAKQKVPATPNWSEAEPKPTLSPNYGIRLNDEYLVIDVDTRRPSGKLAKGEESWAAMRALLKNELPSNQFLCRTMSGGWHYWFKKPKDLKFATKLKEYPNVDVLSGTGRFIVGPGSDFSKDIANSLPYQVIQGEFSPECIPDCPEEFLAIFKERNQAQYERVDFDYKDTENGILNFINGCKAAPVAVEGCGGDDTTLQVAMLGHDQGLLQDTTFKLMVEHYNPRCEPEWPLDELYIKVRNAYRYASGGVGAGNYFNYLGPFTDEQRAHMEQSAILEGVNYNKDKNNNLKHNDEDNVINFLTSKPYESFQAPLYSLYRFNDFTGRIEYSRIPPWMSPKDLAERNIAIDPLVVNDEEIGNLKRYLNQVYCYNASRDTIYHAVEHAARRMNYHPIQNWLKSLVWDGKPRLERWLYDYLDVELDSYTKGVAQAVLCGAVARILNPGCKFDYVLILEGPQGVKKSQVCELLARRQHWFASVTPDTDKDTRMVLARKWIIELAELDSFQRRSPALVKNFITTAVDTIRKPYGHLPEDMFRQSICIGSVNPLTAGQYLHDTTGGRRFWPVEVGIVDLKGLEKAVPQLYAEAMYRYKKLGDKALYLLGEAEQMAIEAQQARQQVDPYYAMIADWWRDNPQEESVDITHLAAQTLGIPPAQFTMKMKQRILDAAGMLGCVPYGPGRMKLRAPGLNPTLEIQKLKEIIPGKVREIRSRLSESKVFTPELVYGMITDDYLAVLEPEAKQSFSRRVLACDGVEVVKTNKPGGGIVRSFRFYPIAEEKPDTLLLAQNDNPMARFQL